MKDLMRLFGRGALASLLALVLGAGAVQAQVNAYVASTGNTRVLLLDTATNTVVANIPTGNNPINVVESPSGFLYVCNNASGTISIIDTATYTVTSTLSAGDMWRLTIPWTLP